ncbi:MAG: FG-GAP-like repeat-containing protein [Myxococcota bacterium]|nr:FG-GAP-like repeat-containing protein [Myxococcota bacterium]
MSILSLLLFSCDTVPPVAKPVLEEVEPFTTSSLRVYSTTSTDSVIARAALVTTIGTGIKGGDIAFTITAPDGSTSLETVQSDAMGFAEVEFELPEGHYIVEASADGLSGSGEAVHVSLPAQFPSSMGSAAVDPEASTDRAIKATGGSYLVSTTNIYYYPDGAGLTGTVVAEFPTLILGAWSAHIDDDGVLDVVAWSDSEAYLLRGHPSGGLHFMGGYRIPDHGIVSVMAEDLNLDGHADVVIAGSASDQSVVTMLMGSGSWSFEEQTPLMLVYPIDAMSASDEIRDGRFEVNVISALDGIVRRHSLNENNWLGGSPSVIAPEAFTALPGSILPPLYDIDADGRKDLVIVGGQGASSQTLVFFIISSAVTKYDQTYGAFYPHFYDVDSNTSVDILAMEEDTLNLVSYDIETGNYSAKSIDGLGVAGPITAADSTGDGLAEVTTFNPHPMQHFGVSNAALSVSWSLYTPSWRRSETNFSGKHVVWDLDQDGTNELIGFVSSGSSDNQSDTLRLRTMPLGVSDNATPNDTSDDILDIDATTYSSVALGNSAPLDLVGCGDFVYALTNNGNETQLQKLGLVTVEQTSDLSFELLNTVSTNGNRLSCHTTGGEQNILVYGGTDTLSIYNEALQSSTSNAGNNVSSTLYVGPPVYGVEGTCECTAQDCSSGCFDNANNGCIIEDSDECETIYFKSITGCTTEDCEIISADLNGNGIDEVIRANPDSPIEVLIDSSTDNGLLLPFSRTLETLTDDGPILPTIIARDLDLDGQPELLIRGETSGLFWVYRGVDGGLAPAYSIQLFTESVLMPYFADIDGDGIPEGFTDDSEGRFASMPLSTTLE